ncbi:nicotinamidase/pyrazinamidase [Novosphingobium sp. PhB165]|uniref:cysteine hydrolase family protein n=1 Tax=Novosphingobium sp. PhB165 TaxID=2485105 RepID=UPI00104651D0|nr:isochorismatase family protein [Novosphingobium sp. PhB165]TCM20497.1 nicotinamidase/pyrazinamidase [Novosphingobium sp. PhB165]
MAGFVIVVDMQRDFVKASGALPVPDAEAIVAPMQQWLAALDPQDTAGVLMTFDTHVPDVYVGSPEAEAFPIHCVRGTAGWETVLDPALIDPAIPVHVLEKGVFDMWAEPGIAVRPLGGGEGVDRDAFFARLAASGVRDVTVVGVAADYCVRWAADGLIARGFAVALPAALTRGIGQGIDAVAEDLQARGEVTLV